MEKFKIPFILALLINMNIMIGAGVYISPPQMSAIASSYSYLGWILSAIVFLPVVLSISKLSQFYPEEGGLYNYSKKSFGINLGFVCAWSYFLGFVAAEALQLTILRQTLCKVFACSYISEHFILFNFIFFSLMFFLCTFTIKIIASLQSLITIIKISPIFMVILFIFIYPHKEHGANIIYTETFDSFSLEQLIQTIPLAIFGFWGFEACCNISHKISGHKKNASRATWLSFVLVALIYSSFHFELINIMGAENLASQRTESLAKHLFFIDSSYAHLSSLIFAIALCISYFNAIFSEILSYSFLIHSMAKENSIFFAKLLKKNNKNKQPVFAIGLNCILAFILSSFVNNINALVVITNLGVIISFLICLLALLKILFAQKKYFNMLTPTLGLFSCFVILNFNYKILSDLKNIYPFLLLFFMGLISFFAKRKPKTP